MNKLSTLSEEYQGKDGQSNLIAQSKLLSNSYKELKKVAMIKDWKIA